jgi:hypothetical protein
MNLKSDENTPNEPDFAGRRFSESNSALESR